MWFASLIINIDTVQDNEDRLEEPNNNQEIAIQHGNVYLFVDKFAFAVKVECNYFSESDWKWKDLVKVLNQTAPSLYTASSW